MIQLRKLFGFRHLRTEPTVHVLHFRRGKRVRSGPGLAFWFDPLNASVAAIPVDDREQAFVVNGRTLDFQEATVQGTITYRVADPERVARHIDFGVDLDKGKHLRAPLQRLAGIVGQLAQQIANDYFVHTRLHDVMREGVRVLRGRLEAELPQAPELDKIAVEIVSVRVAEVTPSADVEKALKMPTRESIQQAADQATFERRAMAVEKERAIAENELHNRIELARREETLIEQEGTNGRRRAEEDAAAQRITTTAQADDVRIAAAAEAERVRAVEGAAFEAERARLEAYAVLPAQIVFGLAARELAGKIESIGHLNVAPESLGPLVQNLVAAATDRAEAG